MSVPVFTTEIAFGSKWGDTSFGWTEVSSKVGAVGFRRGREEQLSDVGAGVGDGALLDDTSDFSPANTSSPYYPNVKVLVPIRMYATIASTPYQLFQQFVEEFPRTRQGGFAQRNITTVDGFDFLAGQGLGGLTRPAELSGARINAVLDFVGWPSGRRVISTGLSVVPAISLVAGDTTKALTHLLAVADAELGIFFINRDGNADFVDRRDQLGSPFNTSQVTFTDRPSSGKYMYVDSKPIFGKQYIFNQWIGTRAGGDAQTAADPTSDSAYGTRTKTETPLLTTDIDVKARAQYRLAQYKDPLEMLQSITVTPGEDTVFWQKVLPLDIGSRVTVEEHPPGGWDATVADYIIQNIDFPRGAGSDAGAQITYGLWPADVNAWMVLNDPTFGRLDLNKLGF